MLKDEQQIDSVFKITSPFRDPLRRTFFSMTERPVERLLLFHELNRIYTDVRSMPDPRPFPDKALERLNIAYSVAGEDFSRLILQGPVVVIANHPFGGIEGLILASLLRSIRPDVKFLANFLLNRIPEMRDLVIAVNPFGTGRAKVRNTRSVRESIRWVQGGGMLVVFPAGEVSSFDLTRGRVTDPAWSEGVVRLIRRTGAPVIPVFFDGTNSLMFQVAGLIHPRLRTALLPAELLNKGGRPIAVRVGASISAARLAELPDDRERLAYLRMRTYLLKHRDPGARLPARRRTPDGARRAEPIIGPRDTHRLASEIAALPANQELARSSGLTVYEARADQIPLLLIEIGRLRELTFRGIGEGTGRELDLDRFDEQYRHLFIWNRDTREVVGAYRLGLTDEILRRQAHEGLYTSTLFSFRQGFLEALGPSLELGRSFIRQEYQKHYAPLLLLWKGIGRFVVRHPRCRVLFGPVSITNEYLPASRQLMMRYLLKHASLPSLAGLAKPKNPPKLPVLGGRDSRTIDQFLRDLDGLSEVIADIEQDGKSVPILLKQYLKLGGRIVNFNIDPAFQNALDGLVVVDLVKTERRTLERYLGREGATTFLAYHHARS